MTDPIKAEPVAWVHARPGHAPSYSNFALHPIDKDAGWTETPLYTHAQLVEERRLAWNEAIEAAAEAFEAEAETWLQLPARGYCSRLGAQAIRALTKENSYGDL